MMTSNNSSDSTLDRARRSVREIALAAVLTLIALVFVLAAMKTNEPETAAVSQPAPQPISSPN